MIRSMEHHINLAYTHLAFEFAEENLFANHSNESY